MRFISLLLLRLCGVCSNVVILGLSVRLSRYHMWWLWWLWCMCCCLCGMWVCWASAGVGNRRGVVSVSVGHEYMGGTHGSGIVFSADDVLEMSLVCGMTERNWWSVWNEFGLGWDERIGFGLYQTGGYRGSVSLGLCLWPVQVSVYCARQIPVHFWCTQCPILLLIIDICFLPYICLWQISQLCLHVVVGPGLVSPLTCFYEEQCQPTSGSAWPTFL